MSDDATPGTSDSGGTPTNGEPISPSGSRPGGETPPPFQPEKTVQRPRDMPPPPPQTQAVPAGGVLVDDPEPGPSGLGGGRDEPPAAVDDGGPDFPTHAGKAGTTAAVIAIGTGLLGAAATIAATRARADGDLDWSNYGVGLAATAALLVLAVLGALASASDVGGRAREEAITWPGVVGILSTAVMVAIGINEDDKWVDYLIGAIVLVLALVGYLLARRGAFAVVGILGLGLIYGRAFDDIVGDSLDGDNAIVTVAIAIAIFVVGVSLLGWLLPSRALIGVSVGVIGVVGYTGLLVVLLAARFLGGLFGSMAAGLGGPNAEVTPVDDGFQESDVWWVLVLAGVLTVLWALAASITNHPGFTVLAIVMPTAVVPLATVALAAEKPSLWAGILAAAGGVLLIGGIGLARQRGKKALLLGG